MGPSTLTGGRDEYYALELPLAARRLVEEILRVRPAEMVVITADTQADQRVVWATASAVVAARAAPVVLVYPTPSSLPAELPDPVVAAILRADVWIEFAVGYSMYTDPWLQAVEAGVQCCELDGLDVDGYVRCIGLADVIGMRKLGGRLARFLTNCGRFRVTSGLGTDVTCSNLGVRIGAFSDERNEQGVPVVLPGQLSWHPVEGSLSGRIVADGMLFPPSDVGVLQETVCLDVEEGCIVAIEGGRVANRLEGWLEDFADPSVYLIAHVSYGFNPSVLAPTGRMTEDERTFGSMDFGWGAWLGRPSAAHFDISVLRCTTWADDVNLAIDGAFVEPELASIASAVGLGVP